MDEARSDPNSATTSNGPLALVADVAGALANWCFDEVREQVEEAVGDKVSDVDTPQTRQSPWSRKPYVTEAEAKGRGSPSAGSQFGAGANLLVVRTRAHLHIFTRWVQKWVRGWVGATMVRKTLRIWHKCSPNCDFYGRSTFFSSSNLTGGSNIRGKADPNRVRKVFNCLRSI
jgi:hypothetical protein